MAGTVSTVLRWLATRGRRQVVWILFASLLASSCAGGASPDDQSTTPSTTSDEYRQQLERIARTYETLCLLLGESRKEADETHAAVALHIENEQLIDVLERILAGLDVSVVWHPDVDPFTTVTGSFASLPIDSIARACAWASVGWHVGPGVVYVDAHDSTDTVFSLQYTLPHEAVWRAEIPVGVEPTVLGARWRTGRPVWQGQTSALVIEQVDDGFLSVTGYASDHAWFLELVPWAKPQPQ